MRSLLLFLTLAPVLGIAQERIRGLVEIPALHGSVNSGGPDIAVGPVPLFAEPSQESAIAVVVLNRGQLESREHGYEQVSAAVYALEANAGGGLWYKLRHTVGERTVFGWLNQADAGNYRDLHSRVLDGLAYLTDEWNRRMFEAPRLDAPSRVFDGLEERPGARVIDVHYERGGSEPWYLLALVRGSCSGEPLEIVATGWVPAYTDTGGNTVWYYSRGC
jgi:hypothetical protein